MKNIGIDVKEQSAKANLEAVEKLDGYEKKFGISKELRKQLLDDLEYFYVEGLKHGTEATLYTMLNGSKDMPNVPISKPNSDIN